MKEKSNNLKSIRKERGLTVKEVVDGTGIPMRTYQNYEYMEREIGAGALQKLADFYGVTTDYLLGRSDAKPPEDPIKLAAQEFHLNSTQRGILAAYLYMDPDDRKQLIACIKQIAERAGKKDDSIKSGIQKRTPPVTYAMRASARSDGSGVVIDEHTMTKEQIDAIQNTPEMDTDL